MRTTRWWIGASWLAFLGVLGFSNVDAFSAPAAAPAPASEGGGGCAAGLTTGVTVSSFVFTPAQVNVNVGDTVRWTDVQATHTSTEDYFLDGVGLANTVGKILDKPLWDSKALGPGQSFEFQFCEAGTYDYHCDLHSGTMRASVVVA